MRYVINWNEVNKFLYRMRQKTKEKIAKNIVAFMVDDTPLLQESISFICNWVMTDGAEKTKALYDVWDIILKTYLPKERPVLFCSVPAKEYLSETYKVLLEEYMLQKNFQIIAQGIY